MGPGGMVSFGHAAYFGLGAYGAGLAVKHLAVPMSVALRDARPLVALAGALLFGWFCVRLAGVYLAMLSLAFAQIVYAIVFQWYEFTGGDNGLVGHLAGALGEPHDRLLLPGARVEPHARCCCCAASCSRRSA